MSTPGDRPSDGDRDAAIARVEAAWAGQQINELDRTMRLEQVRNAHTVGELEMILHDLRGAAPPPAGPTPVMAVGAVSPQPTGTASEPGNEGTETGPGLPDTLVSAQTLVPGLLKRLVGIGVLVVVLGVGGGLLAVVSAGDLVPDFGGSGPAIELPPAGPGPSGGSGGAGRAGAGGGPSKPLNTLSLQGYADLVDAVEDETGSTEVFDAVLYSEYAVLQVPVDRRSQRQQYYRWDGTLSSTETFGTASGERLDLGRIDATALAKLSRRAREDFVKNPVSWYVIIRAPDAEGAVLWAYANDKFSSGGYLAATADGKVVRRVSW